MEYEGLHQNFDLKIPLARGQKIANPINCYSTLGSGSLSTKNKNI
jgi:hypothetical protein